jgi:hypothetical protein
MSGLNLDTLNLQVEHAERMLIRACVDHPGQRHRFAIWVPDLTMDEVVLARRVALEGRDDFRARIEVTDSLRGSGLYDVRIYFTAQLDRIATPRLLQQFSREWAGALARQFDREIIDSMWAATRLTVDHIREIRDLLTGERMDDDGSQWRLPYVSEPPTTACDWCPKVFPAEQAYRSTKDGALICPACFESARKGGRAHLVEDPPGEEQRYGNLLAKRGS